MTRQGFALTGMLLAGGSSPLAAQLPIHARLRPQGVAVVHQEQGVERSANGFGYGGAIVIQVSRVTLEASGYRASLETEWDDSDAFDVLQGDARLSVLLYAPFALEVGLGRRTIDPELSAPGVGWYRVGATATTPLTRLADVTLRGAYLVPEFDGGGDAGFSIEVGLAAAVGMPNGRFRVRVEYDFQRMDRTVNQIGFPLQVTVARAGIDVGF